MFFEPINETYFGKTPELLDIEKTISKIRKKYNINDPIKTVINDSLITEVENKIAKTFGFSKVYFGFDQAVQYNCYTVPVRQKQYGDLVDKYEVTSTGVRYKKETDYSTLVVYTTTLFFSDKITDGEIVAVLLHEIGHNFTEAVVPIEVCFETFRKSLQAHISSFMAVATQKTKELPIISDTVKTIGFIVTNTPNFINNFFPDSPTTKNLIMYIGRTSDRRRYIDEKFADQFATMYGYGVELSSVLSKIEYNKKKDPNGEIAKLLDLSYGLINTSLEVMFSNTPMLAARMKTSVNLLEYEIKNNETLPPELKKDLQKQIKDIDLLAKQYAVIDKTPKYNIARKGYFSFMFSNIKEGDLFSKYISTTYNLDKINLALEKNKRE